MLDILKVADGVEIEEEKDSLGGGGAWDTGVYPLTCEYMYVDKTTSGALMVFGSFKDESSKRTIRFSECVMSKASGTLKSTYTDKKTNEEKLLPGYTKVLSLAHILGLSVKDLSTLDCEERTLKLYDFDAKEEVPQEKMVFTDFVGGKLQAAIYRKTTTVKKKDDAGKYSISTAETRDENEFTKFFDESGYTLKELKDSTPAKFKDEWATAHTGKIKDARDKNAPKGDGANGASTAGAPPKKTLNFG